MRRAFAYTPATRTVASAQSSQGCCSARACASPFDGSEGGDVRLVMGLPPCPYGERARLGSVVELKVRSAVRGGQFIEGSTSPVIGLDGRWPEGSVAGTARAGVVDHTGHTLTASGGKASC